MYGCNEPKHRREADGSSSRESAHLHAGNVLQPTRYLKCKVVHVFHIHETLCVEVVVTNGCHRVCKRDRGCVWVMSRHFPSSSTVTAGTAATNVASGGGGEHKVGVATARSEHRVLAGDEWLGRAAAGG